VTEGGERGGPAAPSPEARPRRRLLLITSLVIALVYVVATGPHLIPTGDQATFVLLGKSLATGQGYRDIGRAVHIPHTKFPPGLPLMLAPVSKLPHRSTEDFLPEKLLVAILGLLAALAVLPVLRRTGATPGEAALVALLTALNARQFFLSHTIMSEAPFLLATLLFVLAVERWRRDGRVFSSGLVFSLVAVFLALSLRTAGVALVLAGGLFLVLGRREPRQREAEAPSRSPGGDDPPARVRFLQATCLGVFSLLLLLGWSWRNLRAGGESLDYLAQLFSRGEESMLAEEDGVNSLGEGLVTRALSGSVFYAREARNLLFLEEELVTELGRMLPATTALSWIFVLLLSAALLELGMDLVRRRSLASLITVVTLGMLVLWPWRSFRLLAPVLPFLLLFLVRAVSRLSLLAPRGASWRLRHLPAAVILGSVLAVNVAAIAVLVTQGNRSAFGGQNLFSAPGDATFYRKDYRDYLDLARETGQSLLPSEARVLCSKPELFHLFSGLPCVAFLPTSEAEALLDQIERHGITHVVLDPLKPNPLKEWLREDRHTEPRLVEAARRGRCVLYQLW